MSGSKVAQVISWDSCVFLGWFGKEADKPVADMRAWIGDIEKGKVALVASAVVCAEVLDTVGVNQAGTDFRGWVKRNNIVRADASWRIAEMAVDYRERVRAAQKLGLMGSSFKAPDALIAATAVLHKVDVLHSFDPVLNELSGSNIIDGLCVAPPLYTREEHPMFDEESPERAVITLPEDWRARLVELST